MTCVHCENLVANYGVLHHKAIESLTGVFQSVAYLTSRGYTQLHVL